MVMSSDAWGRRKFGDQFGRGWSRRERHRPEGEDQKEAADLSTIRLVVDQEMFEVSERAGVPGQYDFDWLSGPNKSYGFTSATSDGSPETVEDLEDAIRDFLTMIDPETGYISDDEDDDLRDPSKPPLGWPPDSSTGDRA
jgi:hypothetical protein